MNKMCCVEGCIEQIRVRFLMCPRHWRMVPMTLRSKIMTSHESSLDFYDALLVVYAKVESLN